MTEREYALYEAVTRLMPLARYEAKWPSGREMLAQLEALLESMPDLKAEQERRFENALTKAGWVREGSGWTLRTAA